MLNNEELEIVNVSDNSSVKKVSEKSKVDKSNYVTVSLNSSKLESAAQKSKNDAEIISNPVMQVPMH